MKKIVLALLMLFIVQQCWAEDFVAKPRKQRPKPQVVFLQPRWGGSVPKAVRLGNPLQMINPLAPPQYGNGEEYVYNDDHDPFQSPGARRSPARGLKFFVFEW